MLWWVYSIHKSQSLLPKKNKNNLNLNGLFCHFTCNIIHSSPLESQLGKIVTRQWDPPSLKFHREREKGIRSREEEQRRYRSEFRKPHQENKREKRKGKRKFLEKRKGKLYRGRREDGEARLRIRRWWWVVRLVIVFERLNLFILSLTNHLQS